MENFKRKRQVNPFVLVILSFLVVILVGSVLLTMPWANTYGKWLWNTQVTLLNGETQHITFMDSFLTAVSATCVTGLHTYRDGLANSLTFGGQLIVLIMIQIGGLGFITVLTFLLTLIKSKLQFKDRFFIAQMVSATKYTEVVSFVRKLILITVVFEILGTLLGLPVFLEMFEGDVGKAVWMSVFHSLSAFNNAGFDLFTGSSFVGGLVWNIGGASYTLGTDSWLYYYFCSYVMLLIICGGLSYLTTIDVFLSGKKPRQYRAFTKIILTMSISLILIGAVTLYLSEGFKGTNNMTFFDALFQSVSSRTAGFSTFNNDHLSIIGKTISCFLMFIGGAPLGTAGGIKVTTIFVMLVAMYSYFTGRPVAAFKRMYSQKMVIKSMALAFISVMIVVIGFIAISGFGLEQEFTYSDLQSSLHLESDHFEGYLFQVFSSFTNTGFGIGFESYLSIGSKFVLCLLMFLGRLGPMTFFSIFQTNMEKDSSTHYSLVEEDFLIG